MATIESNDKLQGTTQALLIVLAIFIIVKNHVQK